GNNPQETMPWCRSCRSGSRRGRRSPAARPRAGGRRLSRHPGVLESLGPASARCRVQTSRCYGNRMKRDDSIADPPTEGRPPAVLQIIPSLVSGGAERGTVDLAGALAAAGWTAYVASSGGPMERQLARLGVHHLTLPPASKNPLVMRRNAAALTQIIRRHKIDIVHARSRAPAWSAWSAAR